MACRSRPTVVVADDVHSARILLRTALEPEFEIVGEAVDSQQVLALCSTLRPDAVVIDPDRFDALGAIRRHAPRTRVLVFSATAQRRSTTLGAHCYVDKAAPLHELRDGLRALVAR